MFGISTPAIGDRRPQSFAMVIVLALVAACSTVLPAPTASLNAARESIASAQQLGARQYAGAELDEAQQKLVLAERAVGNKEMIAAGRFADEARIAAELASARTESAKSEEINQEMQRGLDALKSELQRKGQL